MKKTRIQTGIIAIVLLAGFLSGCQEKEEQVLAVDGGKSQAVLLNIAEELPRGGEAQLVEALWAEEEAAPEEGQQRREEAVPEENTSGSEPENTPILQTIRVVTVGSLNEELLQEAEPYLRKQGYGLEIIPAEDYESPNTMLAAGEADANFFQHSAYLARYNQERGTQLSSLGAVYYEPLGLYPGITASLEGLQTGSRIGVPANPTGYARALFLLKQEGLLELSGDADLLAVWEDVTADPYGLELIAMEEEELVASLKEVDLAVFSTGQALAQGLDPAGFLALEAADSLAAGSLSQLLVVREGAKQTEITEKKEESTEQDDGEAKAAAEKEVGSGKTQPEDGHETDSGLQLLLEILRSEEIKEVVSKEYRDSIIILE